MYMPDSESGDGRNPGMRRGVYIGSAKDGSNIFVGEVSINGMTMFMLM